MAWGLHLPIGMRRTYSSVAAFSATLCLRSKALDVITSVLHWFLLMSFSIRLYLFGMDFQYLLQVPAGIGDFYSSQFAQMHMLITDHFLVYLPKPQSGLF